MPITAPHYLLLTETDFNPHDPDAGGRWRFVLEPMNGDHHQANGDIDRIEVSEREADVWGERLQLLAVVRGVEALAQPSKLTLITNSALVGKQMRMGFDRWIENDWRWERFGLLKPVKDADLWKRIHAAMQIHSIECRCWQFSNRFRASELETQESDAWNRNDASHPRVRKPIGPAEFEKTQTHLEPIGAMANAAAESFDEPSFVATRTGWTRVTEIDPDSDQSIQFPQAFGTTAL